MSRLVCTLLICFAAVYLAPPFAWGQAAGSRATADGYLAGLPELPLLEREIAEGYITIEGLAEVRTTPTEIRVVLAVTAEGETAQECQRSVQTTVDRLKAAWTTMKITPEAIVVDFIAVVPCYAWTVEKRDDTQVAVEKKAGYRMQTNIHLAVENESQAQQALGLAFEEGVTDIIAFDYWSKELDETKGKARELALKAARAKADVLIAPLFEDRPPPINVQEWTTIRYPESLYHSVAVSNEETIRFGTDHDLPRIHASRPRNTYYRGLYSDGDVQPRDLPMHPEISVISTVRQYFKSPAADARVPKAKRARKE